MFICLRITGNVNAPRRLNLLPPCYSDEETGKHGWRCTRLLHSEIRVLDHCLALLQKKKFEILVPLFVHLRFFIRPL